MKKLVLVGSTWAMSLLFMTGCGSSKQEENHHQEQEMEHYEESQQEAAAKEVSLSFKDDQTDQVFQHYLHVKTALVKGDAKEAGKGAEMILASVNAEDFDGVAAAKTISEATDIAAQREAFVALSAAVEKEVEGKLASGAVYKQYCPMAFEGKGGSWLSDREAIRNPYYGDKMLTCGRVDKVMGEL